VKSKKQKQEEVEHLQKEFESAENLVVVQYKGLNVEQDTELRARIRAADGKYRVVKNRLATIAAKDTPASQVASFFDGPTAIAYNRGEPVALAKALSDYAKDNPSFEFKAGIVEGRVVELATLAEIASLPSHDELLAKLMYLLNSGAQRIGVGLSAVTRNLAVALGQAVEQGKFSS
jgi:large subunit ribosomal protein L10